MVRFPPVVLFAGLLALPACHGADSAPTAADVLAAARRAQGPGADALRAIETIATVTAPDGEFTAAVRAARGGRFRIELGSTVGGVDDDGGWLCDSVGHVGPLDLATRTVLHGHDLHLMILEPEGWLRNPELAAPRRWEGDSVLAVTFRDELDAPLTIFYRISDTLPVGAALVNHGGTGGGDVTVFLRDWRGEASLRLFHEATFVQDGNRYVHRYTRIVVNDSTIDPVRSCPLP